MDQTQFSCALPVAPYVRCVGALSPSVMSAAAVASLRYSLIQHGLPGDSVRHMDSGPRLLFPLQVAF